MSVETQALSPPSNNTSPGTVGTDGTPTIVLALPNWIFPSMNSIAFDNSGDVVLPAIGVEATIFTFQVPKGFNGVMKTIANAFIGSGFTDGSGQLLWRILQNNQAMRGKENMANSLGSVAQPSLIGGGGFIRILENDIIAMIALNVSIPPAGQIVAGRLSGWFYPKDEDPQGIWF